MRDLAEFIGPAAFGSAYQTMLENDAHANGSVDRVLCSNMVRLCPETANYLYTSFTPLALRVQADDRPELRAILNRADAGGGNGSPDDIVKFTATLGRNVSRDLATMVMGGTEEEIVRRGSEWCPDVARVACVLCQLAGFPARIVWLFNLDAAYSGHVIVEAFREDLWGALDPSTAIAYRHPNGHPATTWDLMNDAALVEDYAGDPKALYTSVGQFRSAGVANYFVWRTDQYEYATSQLNEYYSSILTMSDKGWPGGLRWLHGEDGERAEQALRQKGEP